MSTLPLPRAAAAESSQPLALRLVRSIGPAWRVMAFAGGLALVAATLRGPVPDNDPAALAAAIGRATHGVVQPRDVVWEPSGGMVSDLVLGRFALALGSETPGAPRDVWRVRVRLSPEGHPLSVSDAHDLTQTPLGDDHSLVIRGTRAAFATFAYEQEQSASLLDLSGEGAQNSAGTTLERLTSAVTNLQQTGTTEGVARVDVGFDSPAERVGLVLDERSLRVDLGDASGERQATLEYVRSDLAAPVPGVHAQSARHLPKPFVFWAVDTVRAVPWIGPAPVAWLEEKVFALRDSLKQARFHLKGQTAEDELASTAPQALEPTSLGEEGAWPPANMPSIWKSSEPGEGAWKAYAPGWMKKLQVGPTQAPPAFFTTFVRPDEARPYAHVTLVAMDMRQLDLEMEAGTEDPKPLTGQHGPGRLPRDPAVYTRVVAAFNGAFKTEHGNYGMMVHKRVLLPPQPSAATVVLLEDGRAGFGTWGASPAIGGIRFADGAPIRDDDILSFRQNLDPLLDGDRVNPTGRALWGYTLPGTSMQTERSGICVTKAGHMMYAWGDDVSATTLGKAMRMAGCDYGMHLDMNPHHTGFLFMTIRELKGHDFHSEALTPLMELSTERYIEYAPKDFFYMLLRDPTPPKVGDGRWEPDPGTQPAPAWSPGIWSERLGGASAVTLTTIERGRAGFRIVAGGREPDPKTGTQPAHELGADDRRAVLMELGLGVAPERHPSGLVTSGKRVLPFSIDDEEESVLLSRPDGTLAVVRGDDPQLSAPSIDAAAVPALLRAGKLTHRARLPFSRAKETTGMHVALGLSPDGRVFIASGEVSSPEPLALALAAAGCADAVLLDRGEDAAGAVLRAGTSKPPVLRSDETALFVLGRPLKPRGFRFEAAPR
ncbi:MAG TPA: hypothetical protein VLM85_27655 [Polyangiaceae bacterium]|nr:hypothetical protein [Polyangiaceae bacterium]